MGGGQRSAFSRQGKATGGRFQQTGGRGELSALRFQRAENRKQQSVFTIGVEAGIDAGACIQRRKKGSRRRKGRAFNRRRSGLAVSRWFVAMRQKPSANGQMLIAECCNLCANGCPLSQPPHRVCCAKLDEPSNRAILALSTFAFSLRQAQDIAFCLLPFDLPKAMGQATSSNPHSPSGPWATSWPRGWKAAVGEQRSDFSDGRLALVDGPVGVQRSAFRHQR